MPKLSDDELLNALGVEQEIAKKSSYSPREERIITGFEEIQRFVERYGRTPQQGEDSDVFERLFAVRLGRILEQEECQVLLASLDYQGILNKAVIDHVDPLKSLDDDDLLAELVGNAGHSSITELRHVRSHVEIQAAEEIAKREKCEDFDRFRSLFELTEREINSGIRQTRPFSNDASVNEGNFFILGGQLVYVAEKGDEFKAPNGHPDARLRVIYSNGTESNLLLRSLQRALYKDEAGRRLTEPDLGPLFSETLDEDDVESGTIYVLRSMSDHPFVAEHRKLIHKIGVTGGKVETRIANAAHAATYLLADVEVIASYKLAGINRTKLESIFHRIFAPAQLDLTIHDRFGRPVRPKEWFLVPLHVIDEAVCRIRDGSITNVVYDPKTACLVSIAQ
ncbi:GIY-YIG nuclease family protein [Fictibacillus norfolkensis]|uniref:GIY-YIG nuclease family protein n=1 Tax=Fictibacillus norfolkensis TaxID=2762233 RepID=A0ABR8SRG9_9BACL|nr:GIY-YIG nuclease family protein [Fictibacillus norfolkensis]MBD7965953.1 GIY-YIG nuclease family protein [Fictibacillus norfolkensis]